MKGANVVSAARACPISGGNDSNGASAAVRAVPERQQRPNAVHPTTATVHCCRPDWPGNDSTGASAAVIGRCCPARAWDRQHRAGTTPGTRAPESGNTTLIQTRVATARLPSSRIAWCKSRRPCDGSRPNSVTSARLKRWCGLCRWPCRQVPYGPTPNFSRDVAGGRRT